MVIFCCFRNNESSRTPAIYGGKPEAEGLSEVEQPKLLDSANAEKSPPNTLYPKSLPEDEHHSRNMDTKRHPGTNLRSLPTYQSPGHEALQQLLCVLTSVDGGWWDQVERALAASAQHLSATHACIFLISGDSSYASPLALLGPQTPPLYIGTTLPLGTGASPAAGTGPAVGCHSAAVAGSPFAEVGPRLQVSGGASVAVGGPGPSCAAAMLVAEQQCGKDSGRLLVFMDAEEPSKLQRHESGERGERPRLPSSAPPEWRCLCTEKGAEAALEYPAADGGTASAAGRQCGDCHRHFVAVAIPSGHQLLGALSLGAKGPGRPASWTPEALYCTAALLSSTLRVPQVDLACRALSELASATTIHQVVRTLLGATSELIVAVTRIDTQARVAFLQPDVGAAAVFQSAATDAIGPTVRRRLSEVLLVDTSAAAASAGNGGGLLGVLGGLLPGAAVGPGRNNACGPTGAPVRRSLGGTEALASCTPSILAAGVNVDSHRDCFARGAHQPASEEVPVCRGHSLPLKHTLLSEALTQGTGLCIADCNAYVQDSKVYPRDLAVSRGAAPAQSLALATSCHGGRPLLALYATYHSILPQALLQTVVQELGQLLRALTASVAAKVQGALAEEWGHLRQQLLESMRNRSRKGGSTSDSAQQNMVVATVQTGSGTAAATAVQIAHCDSPVGRGASWVRGGGSVHAHGGGGGGGHALAVLMNQAIGEGGATLFESPAQPQSMAVSTGVLNILPPGCDGSGIGATSGSAGVLGLERSRGGGVGGGSGRDGRTSGRASFSLEAASSPRGSSKLAPLIATLHDRLKAAQAEQMANCRAAARMQDLESIRILEQIGRGGYGVVYRGLYHGSEVAIKVIQEAEVAAPGASGDPGGGAAGADGGLRRMNSVALENKHLHDAIELVASVGMGGHPNIVQVLTFFTDVRVMVGYEPVDALNRRLSSLDGVAELLRLTRMPSVLEVPPQTSPQNGGHQAANGLQQQQQQQNGGQQRRNQQEQADGARPSVGGVIVLVQEFCDAGTLKNAINQRAFYRNLGPSGEDRQNYKHLQLNLKAVYSTLLEVALALRHMHGLHMVHCDLKPQNVLLKSSPRDPRGFTAKLSDFGLAKMMAHDEDGQLVIDEAVGSGTLTHMAPESLAGQKQLNASIDMFAFGILMWQMLCGTRLYQGLNTKQIIRGVVRENLRPVFPGWVPLEYRRLAERCWHGNPSERPTANAVVAELESMVDHCSRTAIPSAAALAGAASWRPPRTSSQGPATGLDPPGSPRHPPHAHAHAHAHAQQMQQLQQLQQLHNLQQQQQQQAGAAAAASSLYAVAATGSKGAPNQTSPRPLQQQQQQQQILIQQKLDAAAQLVAGLRVGSQTGASVLGGPAGLGQGRGRLII